MKRIGAVVFAVVVLGACGKSTETKPVAVAPGDSSFCKVAVGWAAHELDPSPGASKTWPQYARDYKKFLEDEAALAPSEIKAAAERHLNDVKTTVDPILSKYGYDPARLDKEGTEQEKKTLEEGPQGAGLTAQNAVHSYEARTCGTGEPVPADMHFTGSADSAYCAAVGKIRGEAGKLAEAGFPPAQTKTFYEGTYTPSFADIAKNPPSGREADTRAVYDFVKTKQLPTLARYGYDIRRILRTGSADDRLAASVASPQVYDTTARNSAYDDQVCTKG